MTDLGGSIPDFVVRKVTSGQPMLVSAIRRVIQKVNLDRYKNMPPLTNNDIVGGGDPYSVPANSDRHQRTIGDSSTTPSTPAAAPVIEEKEAEEEILTTHVKAKREPPNGYWNARLIISFVIFPSVLAWVLGNVHLPGAGAISPNIAMAIGIILWMRIVLFPLLLQQEMKEPHATIMRLKAQIQSQEKEISNLKARLQD